MSTRQKLDKYTKLIQNYFLNNYKKTLTTAVNHLKYPYITPGCEQYLGSLWDWDSLWTNVGLKQLLLELGDHKIIESAFANESGSILNFLDFTDTRSGWIPINIQRKFLPQVPENIFERNMHKPVIAQHAAFLTKYNNGDISWLTQKKDYFYRLQLFINCYINHYKHECGLYFWQNDSGVGVDNDPCSYDRPPRSCGSILLNCFMYKELEAIVYLLRTAKLNEVAENYEIEKNNLKKAIQEYCWDERDGFYYSVDLNLMPRDYQGQHHRGYLRDYPCLIQRIGVWSGFMAMWAGLATKEQATRMVKEHYHNEKTFKAPYGVRTLSKMEKMYSIRASRNPSCWLGPIWGISNYMVFRGLINYGFTREAKELAEKTICLFGEDIEKTGAVHEYYQPGNGEPLCNKGFLNWNLLALNISAWYEERESVIEF
ncbi:MAG: hypothetical protein L3J71_10880 [Victivallaceae bacterium]|nr:hypothetical protein [Victivallaceae bacterium]